MGVLENTLEMIGWLAVREIIAEASEKNDKIIILSKCYNPKQINPPTFHIPIEKGKIPDIRLELPDGEKLFILVQGVFYRNTAHIYCWKKRYELISNYSGKNVIFIMHGGKDYWRQHSKFFLDKLKVGVEAYTTKELEEEIKRIGYKLKFDALKSLEDKERIARLSNLKQEINNVKILSEWFENLKKKIKDKLKEVNKITMSPPKHKEKPTKLPMILRYQDCQELLWTLTKDDIEIFEKIVFKEARKLIEFETKEIERLRHMEMVGLIKLMGEGPEKEILLTYENPIFGRARKINGAALLILLTFYPNLLDEVFTFLISLENQIPRISAYLKYMRNMLELKRDIEIVLSKLNLHKESLYTRVKEMPEEELIKFIREKPGLIPYFNAQILWSMTTLKNWNDVAREKANFKFKGRPINLGKDGEYIQYTVNQAKDIIEEIKNNLKPEANLDYMAKKLWECFFDALRGELKNPKYSFFKQILIRELQRHGIKSEPTKRVKINSDYVELDIKIKQENEAIFLRAKGSIDPGSQPGYLKAQIWTVKEKYPVILVSDGPSLRLLDEDWGIPRCYAQPIGDHWELIDILNRQEKRVNTKLLIDSVKVLKKDLYSFILDFAKVESEITNLIDFIHKSNKYNISKTVKDLIRLPEVIARLWNARLIKFRKNQENRVFISATEEGRLYRDKILSYIKFVEWAPKLGTIAIGCSEDALALLTVISPSSVVPEVSSQEENHLFARIEELHKKACININRRILEEFAKDVGVHPKSREKLVRAAIKAILIYMNSISKNEISKGRWSIFFKKVILPESKRLGIILTMYGYKYNGKRFYSLSQELNNILHGVHNG